MNNEPNLAMLISGRGTTAAAIEKAYKERKLAVKPALVIASKPNIPGIERIIQTGFKKENIIVIDPKKQKNFGEKLLSELKKNKIDIVGQYGWLPYTPINVVKAYKGKIINQHPGPLDTPRPDFGGKGMYGKRVHAAVLYFRRATNHDFWTEAICHKVTEKYDKGEIINRKKIKILPTDSVEDLQKRVYPVEYAVQIEALNNIAKKKIKIFKRKKPLIKKSEEKILEEAKRIAAILYPKG